MRRRWTILHGGCSKIVKGRYGLSGSFKKPAAIPSAELASRNLLNTSLLAASRNESMMSIGSCIRCKAIESESLLAVITTDGKVRCSQRLAMLVALIFCCARLRSTLRND